jgi:hypothetical protein
MSASCGAAGLFRELRYRAAMRELSLIGILALTAFTTVACGSDDNQGAGGSGASSSSSASGGAGGAGGAGGGSAACETQSASLLPGVSVEFTTTDCTYTLAEAAAGIEINYKIVVANDIPGVYPVPQDGGGCGMPGPSGLIFFEMLEGDIHNYCLCDQGICPGPSGNPVTVMKGSYPGTFSWDGRNWSGPSDTNEPKGAPFPAGDYRLSVRALGQFEDAGVKKTFDVEGLFRVHLVP